MRIQETLYTGHQIYINAHLYGPDQCSEPWIWSRCASIYAFLKERLHIKSALMHINMPKITAHPHDPDQCIKQDHYLLRFTFGSVHWLNIKPFKQDSKFKENHGTNFIMTLLQFSYKMCTALTESCGKCRNSNQFSFSHKIDPKLKRIFRDTFVLVWYIRERT